MSDNKAAQNAKSESPAEIEKTTVEVEDIAATDAEEVKGGPKRIFIGGLS